MFVSLFACCSELQKYKKNRNCGFFFVFLHSILSAAAQPPRLKVVVKQIIVIILSYEYKYSSTRHRVQQSRGEFEMDYRGT
jgi:hypothetical protein